MAIVHGDIGGAEPSTITFKVDTVTLDLNSTTVHREVHVIADPQTSNAYARVVAAPPASTEFGQIVRIASGPSSVADLAVRAVLSSTTADNPVTATQTGTWIVNIGTHIQSSSPPAGTSSGIVVRIASGPSSAADLQMRPVFSSTGADNPVSVSAFPANSSLVQLNAIAAGYVSTGTPAAGSSGLNVWVVGGNGVSTTVSVAALPANSSQVEVRALPANSSQVEVRNSPTVVIGTNLQSSGLPAAGSSALMVRQVWDVRLTAKSTNAFASTSFTVGSSVAGQATYVTAYTITSTVAAATKIAFYDGSTMIWPVQLQAVSSGVSGVNLSAYPYLFKGDQARAMTLQTPSSIAGVRVGVSYFQAP